MDSEYDWRLQSDWYSPKRLHDSPVEYDFPGDRFIPNRSLMDLDQARGVLTNRTSKGPSNSNPTIGYREKLENLKLDTGGRPFQMLVFRGSPKSSRKTNRVIDEMRRSDEDISCYKQTRRFPKKSSRILDAPNIKNDYYLNVMDWGKENVLAIALGTKVYLWNADSRKIDVLFEGISDRKFPTSVSWSGDGKTVAVGYSYSRIHLYDAETLKPLRCLNGHSRRVGCLAWNGQILTSGSRDRAIINHDVRANSMVSCVRTHVAEVCGLKWSMTGNILASGGNENLIYIWDACKMSSMHHLHQLDHHRASVKALAWCPYNHDVLASGGGMKDGSLKTWNAQTGTCISSIDTKAQICGLLWNRHHQEVLSGHGYGLDPENGNRICLWKYPSMSKLVEYDGHANRVLQVSQSPDGLTVVSAGADENLRFWEVFGPAADNNARVSYLGSLLSLKSTPIR